MLTPNFQSEILYLDLEFYVNAIHSTLCVDTQPGG